MSARARSNLVAVFWLIAVVSAAMPIFAAGYTADDLVPSPEKIDAFSKLKDLHANTVISIVAMLFGFLTSCFSNRATIIQAEMRVKEAAILKDTVEDALEKINEIKKEKHDE